MFPIYHWSMTITISQDFSGVTAWVFDLDNTLYPPQARLFDQIERLMHTYVMRELDMSEAEANHLRRRYFLDHGTTLNGLMMNHGIAPDPFLKEVHDLDLTHLTLDERLGAAIAALPGRKIVYTNGSREHGERVTTARGLNGVFDAIFGIEDAGYVPKPAALAYTRVLEKAAIAPIGAAMFEDDLRNLEVPYAWGMKAVLVGPNEDAVHAPDQTEDLTEFLEAVLAQG